MFLWSWLQGLKQGPVPRSGSGDSGLPPRGRLLSVCLPLLPQRLEHMPWPQSKSRPPRPGPSRLDLAADCRHFTPPLLSRSGELCLSHGPSLPRAQGLCMCLPLSPSPLRSLCGGLPGHPTVGSPGGPFHQTNTEGSVSWPTLKAPWQGFGRAMQGCVHS